MRKPVTDAEGAAGDTETTAERSAPTSAPSAAEPSGAVEGPAEPGQPARPTEDKPASDWFAPRKSGPAKGRSGRRLHQRCRSARGFRRFRRGGRYAGRAHRGPAGAADRVPVLPVPVRDRAAGSGRPGGVVGSMNVPGGSGPAPRAAPVSPGRRADPWRPATVAAPAPST
ncbi:hypothetical protein LV779_30585 [Streptomyces thinghirensis]|nr:hypothetical protein [Streptomyces thinghirensis]